MARMKADEVELIGKRRAPHFAELVTAGNCFSSVRRQAS